MTEKKLGRDAQSQTKERMLDAIDRAGPALREQLRDEAALAFATDLRGESAEIARRVVWQLRALPAVRRKVAAMTHDHDSALPAELMLIFSGGTVGAMRERERTEADEEVRYRKFRFVEHARCRAQVLGEGE